MACLVCFIGVLELILVGVCLERLFSAQRGNQGFGLALRFLVVGDSFLALNILFNRVTKPIAIFLELLSIDLGILAALDEVHSLSAQLLMFFQPVGLLHLPLLFEFSAFSAEFVDISNLVKECQN